MDNDAVCHMAADVAADLDVNDNVDNDMAWWRGIFGTLSDGPYSSGGPHFSPEFQPLEIISAHQKYPSHLTHRIRNTKIFHTKFSPDTIKFSP
jgi:hypothetical protein